MRRGACIFYVSLLLLLFAAIPVAKAQSGTLSVVYVSQTDGNDVPSCGAIKKPCQTFKFSMTRVAAKGRIIVLNTGEYGPVTITKAVTIEAPSGVDAMIEAVPGVTTAGIEVAAGKDDNVTLRGLKVIFHGSGGIGILFSSGAAMYVERCFVHGALLNIDIFPFNFTGDVRVYVRDSVLSGFWSTSAGGSSDVGIRVLRHSANSVKVEIERTSMKGNYSGLHIGDGTFVTARACVMAGNRLSGVRVGGTTGTFPVRHSELTLEDCVISGNGSGLDAVNTDVTVSHCTITDNDLGIDPFLTPSVQYLSRGNNTLEANGVDGTFTGVYTAK